MSMYSGDTNLLLGMTPNGDTKLTYLRLVGILTGFQLSASKSAYNLPVAGYVSGRSVYRFMSKIGMLTDLRSAVILTEERHCSGVGRSVWLSHEKNHMTRRKCHNG